MNVNAMMSASRNRSLFTPTQWQELEHQALIFKYMVSGVPVPPDLILTVKRSLDASMVFSHTPIGWGGLQMGYGGKTDPEPGRCRRTDGKKWRCSKEAHPDSKYCERHMHRGKSRSRKLVEISAAATATATTSPNSSSASTTPTSSFKKSCLPSQSSNTHHHHHHHLFLDSGSYSLAEKEYGFLNGVGERAFFAERSGTVRSLNDSFTPLTMNSSGEMNFQRVADRSSEEEHCFVLGTDFKSAKSVAGEEEIQKPFHHFLGEWVPKGKESSWLELDTSESNTQLSISMPSFSTADLFQSNSRPYW